MVEQCEFIVLSCDFVVMRFAIADQCLKFRLASLFQAPAKPGSSQCRHAHNRRYHPR